MTTMEDIFGTLLDDTQERTTHLHAYYLNWYREYTTELNLNDLTKFKCKSDLQNEFENSFQTEGHTDEELNEAAYEINTFLMDLMELTEEDEENGYSISEIYEEFVEYEAFKRTIYDDKFLGIYTDGTYQYWLYDHNVLPFNEARERLKKRDESNAAFNEYLSNRRNR